MAIGLTDEHAALADAVRGWAERNVTSDVRRAGIETRDAETRPAFWPGLAGQGLLGLHVPEEYGGQGAGLPELAVALEELGRALVPGPFLPTVLASAALLRSDAVINDGDGAARAELLPGLADGSRTGALSLAAGLTGTREAGGLRVEGTSTPVLGAALADVIVLPVATGQGEEWVAVDATELEVAVRPALDVTRGVASVTASGVLVPDARVLDGLQGPDVLDLAAVLMGAEAAGIAGWCVTTAADYAKVREQFGRPIGQFQGIKHKCAAMLIELEQARA
ncbi:MAG: acyl-CoA dehydrogenase, partial [Streptosporangiales bacterium]|nr:acyl-CoA dehydrogenase [Streptosporangiales bacterium]